MPRTAHAPPARTIEPLAEGLWEAVYPMVLAGGFQLPTRMTVVRLDDESLLCHSPVPLGPQAAAQLSELGEVSVVVAPNCFHHLFVDDFLQHAPKAQLFGAPGLALKRPDLEFDGELSPESDRLWRPVLEREPIEGAPAMNESVFRHRSTNTLLVADLVFNLQSPRGATAAVLLRLMGVHKRFAQSRAWRLFLVKDRAAAARSCRRLLEWQIDRVVPCHGDVFEASSGEAESTVEALRRALSWMLAG